MIVPTGYAKRIIYIFQSAIIFGTPIIGQVGYFKVLRYSYFLKIFLGVIFYLIGPVDISLLMVLMLVDR